MKLVMPVKLLPTPEQAAALHATLRTCNALVDRISGQAYEKKVFSRAGLQKLVYAELKAAGLSAQPALHVIRKTADAYTTLRAQIRYRRAQARRRAELQKKKAAGSRSAARRLARRKAREGRHAAHVNHKIAKRIVADAQRTGRGIALEELSGIRGRVRLGRHQRATLSTWLFHQLGTYIAYKARRAGVPFLQVDPAYTSQTCPRCGHVARGNRPHRDHFCCRRCGLAGPADHIAAVNVRRRARTVWAFVSMPDPLPAQGKGDATPARQPAAQGSATRCERPSHELARPRPRS
ncbi:RNA-guided endonuclease TnpB family protein [Actinomadura violacea]|uniref:RNA-guided endonuclease TnpB family protein n=1 Tax=Actinomadura violacea TaxID=2819934 RepID=UPI003FD85EEF